MIAAPYAPPAASSPSRLPATPQSADPAQLETLAGLWEGLQALAAAATFGPTGAVARLCRALTPASTVSLGVARLHDISALALIAYRRLGGSEQLGEANVATVSDIAGLEQAALLALVRSGVHGVATELVDLVETATGDTPALLRRLRDELRALGRATWRAEMLG